MTTEEKTTKLLGLIDDLCNLKFVKDLSINDVDDIIDMLKEVYANDYRHTYSDIFNKLQTIFLKDMEIGVALGENLNFLSQKIDDILRYNGSDVNLVNASKGFRKFADHINLEIGRYNFIKHQFPMQVTPPNSNPPKEDLLYKELKEKIDEVTKTVDKIRPIATQAQKELDNLDTRLERNNLSSITALTVFSAVILVFSGGITFEAGVFKGIADASAYRLVFIVALTGFILFNTIFALLYIIGKMSGKTISTKCKYIALDKPSVGSNRSCGDGVCTKACSGVSIGCRILHKYSYVFAINLILLWIMYADFILWVLKNGPIDLLVILYIAVPSYAAAICWISAIILRGVQKKRILLYEKIKLISRYMNPIEESNYVNFFNTLINKMSITLSGTAKKNLIEEFKENLKIEDANNDEQYKTLLSKVDKFVEERMLAEDTLADTISWRKNKLNKEKWKILKLDFQKYLIKQK